MLGLPPLPRTLGAALRDVGHARPDVRHSSIRDLTRLASAGEGRGEALAALERVLGGDRSAALRGEAAVALADADAVESMEALGRALGDADARVRQLAMLAFGELGTPGNAAHVEQARALLDVQEAPVRFQALIAFARLSPEGAEPVLFAALGDGDEEVRAMALRLMDARYAAGEVPPAHVLARARAALADTASQVRASAALFLLTRGEKDAERVLVGVIDGSVLAGNASDLVSAIELAASEKLTKAVPALRRRAFGPLGLRSDSVSWHALVALATLGDERARNTILRGLSAWTRHARTLSVLAAGRAGLVAARARIDGFRGRPARADPAVVDEALAALDRIPG
jgi:HEAT repeat protein